VAKGPANCLHVVVGRQDSVRPDETANLKDQGEERRKIDEAQRPQEEPAGNQAIRGAMLRVE